MTAATKTILALAAMLLLTCLWILSQRRSSSENPSLTFSAVSNPSAATQESVNSTTPETRRDETINPVRALNGIVIDANSGQPIAFATIDLLDRNSQLAGSTSTDSFGNFQLQLAQASQRAIRATASGYREERLTLPLERVDDSRLELKLFPVTSLFGTVQSHETLQPVQANVRVTWTNPARDVRESIVQSTDPEGRFSISELPVGLGIHVTVEASNYSTWNQRVFARASSTKLTVLMECGAILSGECFDSKGTPVHKATIEVAGTAAPNWATAHHSTMTDSLGMFAVEGLPKGLYEVTASHGGAHTSKAVRITTCDSPARLRLEFPDQSNAQLVIYKDNAEKAGNVIVEIADHDKVVHKTRANDSGVVTVPRRYLRSEFSLWTGSDINDGLQTSSFSLDRNGQPIIVPRVELVEVEFEFAGATHGDGAELVISVPGTKAQITERVPKDSTLPLKLEPGVYTATVLVGSERRWTRELRIGEHPVRFTVNCDAPLVLLGRTVDDSGAALKGVSVYARTVDGLHVRGPATTNNLGEFEITIEVGRLEDFELHAERDGLVQDQAWPASSFLAGLRSITLFNPASLEVVCSDLQGCEVSKATQTGWKVVRGRTSDNSQRFERLPPGSYRVRSRDRFEIFELTAGQRRLIDLSAPLEQEWIVAAVDDSGSPLNEWIGAAAVSIANPTQAAQARVLDDGRLSFPALVGSEQLLMGIRREAPRLLCAVDHISQRSDENVIEFHTTPVLIHNSGSCDLSCSISVIEFEGIDPNAFFGGLFPCDSFSLRSGASIKRTAVKSALLRITVSDGDHQRHYDLRAHRGATASVH